MGMPSEHLGGLECDRAIAERRPFRGARDDSDVLQDPSGRTGAGRPIVVRAPRMRHLPYASPTALNRFSPSRVIASSSRNNAGSMPLKLKHDLPCMRLRSSGDADFTSSGNA